MAISLEKGTKISLDKAAISAGIAGGANSLSTLMIGLGWDVNQYDTGYDFDLDAVAFLLGPSGKVESNDNFIYYGHKVGKGIEHMGDNLTGAGEGDDEVININLNEIDPSVQEIKFAVTIYQADKRNQRFGDVPHSFIRLVDTKTGIELVRADLGEDFDTETAVELGAIYRHNGEWKFRNISAGFGGGLAALCRANGVNIG